MLARASSSACAFLLPPCSASGRQRNRPGGYSSSPVAVNAWRYRPSSCGWAAAYTALPEEVASVWAQEAPGKRIAQANALVSRWSKKDAPGVIQV